MATMKQVSTEIMNDLNKLSVNGAVWRFIGANMLSLSRERIFDEGKNSEGKQIGDYSEFTIRKKKDDGRFTSRKVNLRNTDTLANSYIVSFDNKGFKLGFTSASRPSDDGGSINNTKLIEKLEAQYGDDLFGATDDELDLIDELVGDYLDLNF